MGVLYHTVSRSSTIVVVQYISTLLGAGYFLINAHLIVLDHLRETRIALTYPPVKLWHPHSCGWSLVKPHLTPNTKQQNKKAHKQKAKSLQLSFSQWNLPYNTHRSPCKLTGSGKNVPDGLKKLHNHTTLFAFTKLLSNTCSCC